jgi:hypothetical protein
MDYKNIISFKIRRLPVKDALKIVNLTPHALNILDKDKTIFEFPKSENPARVTQKDDIVGYVTHQPGHIFPIHHTEMIPEIENLPDYDPAKTVFYVVSRIVAETAKSIGRPTDDLFIPGPSIRDENGKHIGADGFSMLP